MTFPDHIACLRALMAKSGTDKTAPSEREWFEAIGAVEEGTDE